MANLTDYQLTYNKIENMCWDLWFILDLMEVFIKTPSTQDKNGKDNSESCLFLYLEELEKIQEELETLQVMYNR
ncbi:hypothetical protein GF362_06085 [Candidatus Dojkabacteria bacterium]|nr:hypothetical protein [Candidatus Dojkabacteria bacterium]